MPTGFGDREIGNVVSAGSVTAADNDSGLTVTEDRAGGRPFANLYYSVSAAATITVEGRYDLDAGPTTWEEIDTLDTSTAETDNESREQYPWVAYDEIRVSTATTGIDVEFVVGVTR